MTIALATKFQPILDEVYKAASITSDLDSMTKSLDFSAANEVSVFKIGTVGLGDYNRVTGYPAGDVTGQWEAIKLEAERGRAFVIDRMDNEETLGMAFGSLASEFIRTNVAPEVDAYRFAKWASAAGINTTTGAALDKSSILAALDAAILTLDEDEVPTEGRRLYISATLYQALNQAITRTLSVERGADRRLLTFDGMQVIPVPQARFYTAIELDAGSTSSAGGFAKASSAVDVNFILMHPSAVGQATKQADLKIFSPDQNQTADAWLIQYRLYHDAWVWDNKVDGIYLHKKAA
jgi:hypothetical protein